MKTVVVLLGLYMSLSVAVAKPDGKLISGAGYTGVIFHPAMLNKSEPPAYADTQRATYWTPSERQVAQAELAFAQKLAEVRAKTPAGGFHFQEYYTPKYSSRDRDRHIPDEAYSDDFAYMASWMDELETPHLRQYIGITVGGRKAVIINFIPESKVETASWKKQWLGLDKAEWAYYVFGTGQIAGDPFNVTTLLE